MTDFIVAQTLMNYITVPSAISALLLYVMVVLLWGYIIFRISRVLLSPPPTPSPELIRRIGSVSTPAELVSLLSNGDIHLNNEASAIVLLVVIQLQLTGHRLSEEDWAVLYDAAEPHSALETKAAEEMAKKSQDR